MSALILRVLFGGVLIIGASPSLLAIDNVPAPNSDPFYQQLRNLSLDGETVTVTNLTLKRDAGTFHFNSGTLCFVGPVNGKVTGAVFNGDGSFVLDPPSGSERASLKLLTKEDRFNETFSQAVFRFTDATYDEVKKAGGSPGGSCDAGALKDAQNITRHKFKENLEARLFVDVLSPEPGGYFAAVIHGRYSGKELFEITHSRIPSTKFPLNSVASA